VKTSHSHTLSCLFNYELHLRCGATGDSNINNTLVMMAYSRTFAIWGLFI
jgi:hypothetical protein